MARTTELYEYTRNEIIKVTHVAQQFHVFRDTSAKLWETMKTHANEDCRRGILLMTGAGLMRSKTNAALLNNYYSPQCPTHGTRSHRHNSTDMRRSTRYRLVN